MTYCILMCYYCAQLLGTFKIVKTSDKTRICIVRFILTFMKNKFELEFAGGLFL